MKRTILSCAFGVVLGAGFTSLIVRQSNSTWLVSPALVSSDLKDRKSEYLLQGPGWHLPLKIVADQSELRLVFPGSGQPNSPFAVNMYVGKNGIRSISVANSTSHGVTVSRSKRSSGLFDELVVQTPLGSDGKVLLKIDENLDGIFEKEVASDK